VWNEAFNKKGTGETKQDVAALEKKLKVPIIVKIFPDRIFYSSGCYRKAGAPIKIIDHNFHAWGVTEGNFPGDKTVKYYHGNMIDWIHVNRNINPVNIWLFSSREEPSSNKNCKQPICYDQFVKSSGEIYRTEHLQCEMTEFANRYINEIQKLSPDEVKSAFDKTTQTSFTMSLIAAQFAREKFMETN